MELVADIPVAVAEEYQAWGFSPDTQDEGLYHKNADDEENDRQLLQIEEEIDKRYRKGTFRKKLLDTSGGKRLIGAAVLSNLVEFYQARAFKQMSQVKRYYAKYSTLCVDIRNKGSEGSTVKEQSVTPEPLFIRRPDWLKGGITVESEAEKLQLVLECRGDGELEVDLLGRDVRNADGTRYPVWIDCNYFAVNGEVVFEDTKTVCHDKRYVYRRKVVDGEVVTLELRWSECQSSSVLDEYRQLQTNLKQANAKVSTTEAALRNANKVITSSKKQILETKEDNKKLKMQIKSLEESVSFKIGRALTWLPRKLRDGANCLKQHGLGYTIKRTIDHLGVNMGTGDSKKK